MNSSMLVMTTNDWSTGYGLLPQQYVMFKALLGNIISRQASILSFQDVFYTAALLCFAGGLLALLIRQKTVQAKPPSTETV